MKKIIALITCLGITLLFPETGSRLANLSCELFGIGWMYFHHITQMVLSLATIIVLLLVIKQSSFHTWGFTLKNWKWSLFTAAKFAAGWLIITVLLNLLFSFENQIHYEQTIPNIIADLCFDFIVTPLSEEILFRGLIMGILILYFPGKLKIASLSISYAMLFSTLFFSLAHIGINYQELSISHLDSLQLLFTLGLGFFYAFMREKTDSLLGPILAHGFSDGSITVIQLLKT